MRGPRGTTSATDARPALQYPSHKAVESIIGLPSHFRPQPAITTMPTTVPRPGAPLPAGTQAIGQALAGSEPLVALTQRLRASQARLDAVLPLLAPAMRPHVKAGPIDETGWTLLATNSAVSAKLRQMLPALEAHLRTCGWPGPPVRVKMLSPG